ncbi:hypothetical protein AB0465_10380 [Streptomyces griseoviridis]|uniref:hypothetical protein n=1 Tax=Streptomyces griseoviridis TaxID=45398 RepID=UPI00344D1762
MVDEFGEFGEFVGLGGLGGFGGLVWGFGSRFGAVLRTASARSRARRTAYGSLGMTVFLVIRARC